MFCMPKLWLVLFAECTRIRPAGFQAITDAGQRDAAASQQAEVAKLDGALCLLCCSTSQNSSCSSLHDVRSQSDLGQSLTYSQYWSFFCSTATPDQVQSNHEVNSACLAACAESRLLASGVYTAHPALTAAAFCRYWVPPLCKAPCKPCTLSVSFTDSCQAPCR